jgi:hypothetical protein
VGCTSRSLGHNGYFFPGSLGKFWDLVRVDAGHAQVGDATLGWLCLASAAVKTFTILPNAADPERVFSDFGRMITSARTSLAYKQSSRMLIIATDYTGKMREKARASGRSGEYSNTNNKCSDAAAALLQLKEISDCSVSVVPDVPVGGVVLATRSEDQGSGGSGRNGGSGITVRNSSDVILTADSGVSVMEIRDGGCEPDGASGIANSDNELDIVEFLDDDAITNLATDNTDAFTAGLDTVLKVVDIDDPINDVTVGDGPDDGSGMSEEHLPVLGQYPLGHLPGMNTDVPQDTMRGLRGFKISLAQLFDDAVVGLLPPLTSIASTL